MARRPWLVDSVTTDLAYIRGAARRIPSPLGPDPRHAPPSSPASVAATRTGNPMATPQAPWRSRSRTFWVSTRSSLGRAAALPAPCLLLAGRDGRVHRCDVRSGSVRMESEIKDRAARTYDRSWRPWTSTSHVECIGPPRYSSAGEGQDAYDLSARSPGSRAHSARDDAASHGTPSLAVCRTRGRGGSLYR